MTESEAFTGVVLDEQLRLSLHEVCEVCGVDESVVVEMVGEGVVEPVDRAARVWVFSGAAVVRLRRAQRLQRDLHVNLPGAALALDLLEEIRLLKARRG